MEEKCNKINLKQQQMRKLFLLLVFPFVLISCSDNNDNDSGTDENSIIGTWEFVKIESKEVNVSTPELIIAITNDIKKENENPVYTMTFTKDGKVKFVMGTEANTEGTYTLKDNILSYTTSAVGSTFTSIIDFSGNNMTMLTDVTNRYNNKDYLEKLVGAEAAENATINEVKTLETYVKK